MGNNFNFFVISDVFVLQYIIEPNKIVYLDGIDTVNNRLVCTSCKVAATRFYSRDTALSIQKRVKEVFDIEMQIINLI